DQPHDKIYLNHQIYGRCRTEISFNLEEIERIKTFLRLYSRERLDIIHPSVKSVIKNKYFYCRFSIDISPLQLNGFCLDIRKLNKNIFSIPDLIFYQTLSSEIASFLYFCILKRINLTVTGETDTGKTTLINAFDLLTPKEFRKIYVENAVESLDELKFDMHQVKYKTQSLENIENSQFTKSNLIQTLLHRTPDIIFLGEILTMEECKALFHCLSAGLRGFQTIHSKDISTLINRFLYHFNIERICLNDLDLIILMKKLPIGRKIVEISEISVNKGISVEKIFDYNPMTNNWVRKKNLYHTNIIKKIIKYEHLPEEDFNLMINLFKEIFEFLSRFRFNKIADLVSIFNIIGFLASKNNYLELIQFWEKTKKKIKKRGF
ncbi:MAG: Flp pilus assembly complex ATPase component TadA, partial [Candidatus Lokiarchaeota archaeon]|nr:Flp pilus assembly complex ATPase component TadA [Candidatus Lokiarchaeota archaeon]